MSAAIIIPARYGSSRFPGKPLAMIAGMTMLERMWRLAMSIPQASRVIIATEDERIVDHAQSFGGEALMTPEDCRNGTERVYQAMKLAALDEDIILNLQGDAVLTPPWILDHMIAAMESDLSIDLVTPAVKLEGPKCDQFLRQKERTPTSGTTVVFDRAMNALYFSKTIIPKIRHQGFASLFRHIGLYGYRRESLAKYISLEATPLEQTEGLEQLRALEHGMTVRVVIVDYRGRTHWSVDSREDIAIAEEIIAKEGELFSDTTDPEI